MKKQISTAPRFGRRAALGMLAAGTLARPAISANVARDKTLKFVPSTNLAWLDPSNNSGPTTTHARAVFDTLYGQDSQLRPQPQMVEGHEMSEDRMVWTFRLREGLKFHDGEPVLAKDCTASIARWGVRDGFGSSLLKATDHMQAVDDKTFKIYLKRPMASLLDALAHSVVIPLSILPERLAQTDPFKQMPEIIGSGPYRFLPDEYVSGSHVGYARNENYVSRQEKPDWTAGAKIVHFDRMEWTIMPDAATASAALRAGEMDWLEWANWDLAPALARDPNITIQDLNPYGINNLLAFNVVNPPFNSIPMRRAVRGAIDQNDFMKAVVGDNPTGYRLCQSMFGCGLPGVVEMGGPPKDIEATRKAIKDAGYAGEKVVIMSAEDYPHVASASHIAFDLLKRAGMNIELQAIDFATMLTRRQSLVPVDQGGWSMFGSGADVLNLANPAIDTYLHNWVGGQHDEQINSLADQWILAATPEQAADIFSRIQKVAFDDVPYIPLGQYKLLTESRKNLTGVLPCTSAVFWNVQRG